MLWFILAWLLVTHFIADFLLQSREIAKGKSEKLALLMQHASVIFIFTAASVSLLSIVLWTNFYNWSIWLFALVYSVIHAVQDWFIWRLYKRIIKKEAKKLVMPETFAYWEDSKFYAFIGLDQILHIFIMLYLFVKIVVGL